MESKTYRLREFINPGDEHSLILDTSAGLSLGALPGLTNFSETVNPLLKWLDGVVTSPGQARRLATRKRQDGALLIRADWTNALRDDDFVLPPESIHHLQLIDSRDGLDLGASALVTHFLLGYEETIESSCLKLTVQLALNDSLPLIVDVRPSGPRVVLFNKAVELGVSYALEGGADGISIPWPGHQSFETIMTMATNVPVWVKPKSLETIEAELNQTLEAGGAGLWLDERVFTASDPAALLEKSYKLFHSVEAVS